MTRYFEFEGSYDSTRPQHSTLVVMRFNFLGDTEEIQRLDELLSNQEDHDFFEQMEEEFGTLDLGHREPALYGMSSSEVPASRMEEFMERWRTHFETDLGARVGTVYVHSKSEQAWA